MNVGGTKACAFTRAPSGMGMDAIVFTILYRSVRAT